MGDGIIVRDGETASWPRWYIFCCAVVTALTYTVNIALYCTKIITGNSVLDWRLLLIAIPVGIIWGEYLFKEDSRLNKSLHKEILHDDL